MHKYFFIPLLFLFFFCAANAQEKKYVYKDSTMDVQPGNNYAAELPNTDSATLSAKEYNFSNEDEKTDTVLRFNKLNIPADSIEAWKNLKAFGYAKYLDSLLKEQQKHPPKKQQKQEMQPSSSSSWVDGFFASSVTKIIFWVLAAIFVLFIIYRLFFSDGVFRKAAAKSKTELPVAEEEIITPESDFDAFIRQAISSRNYRLAVRYQYLKTLHLLAGRGFVQLAVDKTNYQYVREISNISYQNDFSKLTLNYEYVWYGEFNIDEIIYRNIENGFAGFNKKI